MRTIAIKLVDTNENSLEEIDTTISFNYFTKQLKEKTSNYTLSKKAFIESQIQILNHSPYYDKALNIDDLEQYQVEFEAIYNLLTPSITQEKDTLWALGKPFSPVVLYGTEPFYQLIFDDKNNCVKCSVIEISNFEEKRRQKIQMVYSQILERLYNFPSVYKNPIVHSITDPVTNLPKFYKIEIDNSFVDIYPKGELPTLDYNQIKDLHHHKFDWQKLIELLPPSAFVFEGFSVISISDITSAQSLENIKTAIIERQNNKGKLCNAELISSLQMLVENSKIEFGFSPALKINEHLVLQKDSSLNSILMKAVVDKTFSEEDLLTVSEDYFKKREVLFYEKIESVNNVQNHLQNELLGVIHNAGVRSFAILPIFYRNNMVGALEVYSFFEGELNEISLTKLSGATELLGQLLQQNIDEFEANIENIIKEKFTSLQPSVLWKFNEVAWQYLQQKTAGVTKAKAITIEFKDVYPLYGAIDIRNSTVERNAALLSDLKVQFQYLTELLVRIGEYENMAIVDQLLFKCHQWQNIFTENANTVNNHQLSINRFLEYEVSEFLNHFSENTIELSPFIDAYFQEVNQQQGKFFSKRRALENSMQMLNSTISEHLDTLKSDVQDAYPCYFEKFRTDGVEFDIYIGQSIAPNKPFNKLYLQNIRLWQLSTMAKITKITNGLLPQLENKLTTTQLIFIHSTGIDISFRNDERRFDVEGAYNIRYQIIKKRIDKVHLLNSAERLTQPSKIALVYLNPKEAEEYVGYINFLQNKGILENDLEYLDLEELQGVSGLKALRVGVRLD